MTPAARVQAAIDVAIAQFSAFNAMRQELDDTRRKLSERKQVEKAKANPKLAGWFTGQVIKASGGKANPATVNALVAAKLGL